MALHLYSKFIDYNFSSSFVNQFDIGACLSEGVGKGVCRASKWLWFERGCPNYIGYYATIPLLVIRIAFTVGFGTIPSTLNVEIYTLCYRGFGAEIATTTKRIVHLYYTYIISYLQASWNPWIIFLVNAFLSTCCLIPIYWWLCETSRMALENIRVPN